ncbi:MAG: MerR family transcriptional regulator, partial [Chloroflexota bacterium]
MVRIGEVARQSGVSASTLRYYEGIGLIPAPVRVSGQRRYNADIFRVLRTIQAAQRAGPAAVLLGRPGRGGAAGVGGRGHAGRSPVLAGAGEARRVWRN